MLSDEELKLSNIKLFGYIPKRIRQKEIDKLMSKVRSGMEIKIKYDTIPINIERIVRIFRGMKITSKKGCWLESDGLNYRHVMIGSKLSGFKQVGIHRLSYVLFRGPITNDRIICHYCDVKECSNPMHLFQGTDATNRQDYALKYYNHPKEFKSNELRFVEKFSREIDELIKENKKYLK